MNKPRAIIDIGSNTVRIVIYGGPQRAPEVVLNEKVTAKLGKGVAENGQLSARAMASALAALRRYALLLQLNGVTDWQCVATAAVRDAANGAEFLAQVAALGLQPRLLSGEEEALASARGVMAAFPGAKGVVGDLGGGSLELVDIDGDTCSHGSSMPLGTLRLTRLRAQGGAKFARSVRKALALGDWAGEHNQPLYLVGGAWRALARFAMHREAWPLDDPHGYEMAPERAAKLARALAYGKALGELPGLPRSRLAELPDAAALLDVLVRAIRPSRLVFSSWGLREGLLSARLVPAERSRNPLLAGVSVFCERFGVLPSTAAVTADWIAPAFSSAGAARERQRLAAIMLALASARIEPNLRSELAVDWALRKRWIGVDARERAMLAMAALANTGRTEGPEHLRRLAPDAMLREAAGWGLAIRLCRRLGGCSPGSLSASALKTGEGALVLSVQSQLAALVSESVERDLAVLADWLGLEPSIRIVAPGAGRTGGE